MSHHPPPPRDHDEVARLCRTRDTRHPGAASSTTLFFPFLYLALTGVEGGQRQKGRGGPPGRKIPQGLSFFSHTLAISSFSPAAPPSRPLASAPAPCIPTIVTAAASSCPHFASCHVGSVPACAGKAGNVRTLSTSPAPRKKVSLRIRCNACWRSPNELHVSLSSLSRVPCRTSENVLP